MGEFDTTEIWERVAEAAETAANPVSAVSSSQTPFAIVALLLGVAIGMFVAPRPTREGATSLASLGRDMAKIPKNIENVGKSATKGFSQVTKKMADAEKQAAKMANMVGGSFAAIFSYFECGMDKIWNWRYCFVYYLMDWLGQLLYLIPRFGFWFLEMQDIEKGIWEFVDEIDEFCHEATGYHLIKYSDDIQKKCYKCKIKPFPKL